MDDTEKTMINYPQIDEGKARWLIETSQAGYWELSLRDSLGKKPIAHDKQTVIFLEGHWHLVPVPAFHVKSLGRIGNEVVSTAAHMIECSDDALTEVIKAEAKRLGRRI